MEEGASVSVISYRLTYGFSNIDPLQIKKANIAPWETPNLVVVEKPTVDTQRFEVLMPFDTGEIPRDFNAVAIENPAAVSKLLPIVAQYDINKLRRRLHFPNLLLMF